MTLQETTSVKNALRELANEMPSKGLKNDRQLRSLSNSVS
jgi:hypothetical protein